MSKDKIQLLSPLFLKYQADFEKNSRSRVFAPLAETYRKLGMTDKAMEILSQGIRFHPTYLMGYLGLAFCYYDIKQYNLAYSTLRPFVESNRDNIRLQKLFSDVCMELGKKEEALETLKYLLFINPRDKVIADLVQSVEKEVDNKYLTHHRPIIIPEKEFANEASPNSKSELFDLEKLNNTKNETQNDFDDWMTLDLNPEISTESSSINNNFDLWNLKKGDEVLNLQNEHRNEEVKKLDVKLNFEDEVENEVEDEVEDEGAEESDFQMKQAMIETLKSPISKQAPKENIINNTPLVTHTLVDLYCGQGHTEKALEVLQKILLLNPNDQRTINKIKEIEDLFQPLEQYDEEKQTPTPIRLVEVSESESEPVEVTEEDGRRHLMSLIDEKLGPIEIVEDNSRLIAAQALEEKLSLFLRKIQKRALDYQDRV